MIKTNIVGVILLVGMILFPPLTYAQSVMDNLPTVRPSAVIVPAIKPSAGSITSPLSAPNAPPSATISESDPFTVEGVGADVTADTAAHARDKALMQAERSGYNQLCAKLNVPDSIAKIDDVGLAALVQSFETQSERLSSVRYIGVFNIHFKAAALQRKFGKSFVGLGQSEESRSVLLANATRMTIIVGTPSLATLTQARQRLEVLPSVVHVEVSDLSRTLSHFVIYYSGSFDDLQASLVTQGLVLRQVASGDWELAGLGAGAAFGSGVGG